MDSEEVSGVSAPTSKDNAELAFEQQDFRVEGSTSSSSHAASSEDVRDERRRAEFIAAAVQQPFQDVSPPAPGHHDSQTHPEFDRQPIPQEYRGAQNREDEFMPDSLIGPVRKSSLRRSRRSRQRQLRRSSSSSFSFA